VYFPLYIVGYSVVISTFKTETLVWYRPRVPDDFLAIEDIRVVEEGLPSPPISFSSPEDPWSHREMHWNCEEELLSPLAVEKLCLMLKHFE
jgi:hypothetical protein